MFEFLGALGTVSIILFFVGIALLVVEMFTPGFGIAGGLGILLLVSDIFVTARSFEEGLILAAIVCVILAIFFAIFLYFSSRGKLPRALVLKDSTGSKEGFSSASDMNYLLGRKGNTLTPLRPSGNANFEGVRLDVVSRGEFIALGAEVEVVQVEGSRVVVREA